MCRVIVHCVYLSVQYSSLLASGQHQDVGASVYESVNALGHLHQREAKIVQVSGIAVRLKA